MLAALDGLGIPYEIDDRLVRGLDYYTHTVFEVKSTRPDSGAQATIFAGGRYDHLVEYFGGPQLSGMGFAIGLERLIALAEEEGWTAEESGNADVYIMGAGNVGTAPLTLASTLRAAGYVTDVNLLQRSMKAQFKSADRSGAPVIVIVGEAELQNGTVNVKNKLDNTQQTVAVDMLVNTVKGIIKK